MAREQVKTWVESRWQPLLKYRVKVNILFNGWMVFHFLNQEDTKQILDTSWVKDTGFVTLQKWKIGFDPFTKLHRRNLIWEKWPGLPLELWNLVVIQVIANHLGCFYYWDEGSFGQFDKRMTWVLLEVDFSKGLLEELDLRWGTSAIKLNVYLGGCLFAAYNAMRQDI